MTEESLSDYLTVLWPYVGIMVGTTVLLITLLKD